ncbi:MAG TPA: TonB-dependent receptor [Steroidobacteraceae bacterium]|nr:TonB-dependent receptor [Steroidobacteraceae bacterium]
MKNGSIVPALMAAACACGMIAAPSPARADLLHTIVVTATRTPEPQGRIPIDISVVSDKTLRALDAHGMASALSLVPGVEAPAGGDAGPSSAVPAFWGLHEFDAFLLVVDGVPWGGAFNPAIPTLDLTDVDRIEVMKGSAPVMYGATSFVGVVQVLHYPAGQASNEADLSYGTYGSLRGSASLALPHLGSYRQSVAVDGERLGFADGRESVADERGLYRGAIDVGGGTLRIDANLSFVSDVPPSPVIRSGATLTSLTPINANFNPADARINENAYQLSLDYSHPTPLGRWDTRVSYAYSKVTDIRAFLHPDLSGAADTQNQHRLIEDGYFDTHLAIGLSRQAHVLVGTDLLYGRGVQRSLNGNSAYTVPLDGAVVPPPTWTVPPNEVGALDDRRLFAGQYAQVDFRPDARWDILAGVRLNEAYEHKDSSDLTLPPPVLLAQTVSKTIVKPTETVGASYRLWRSGRDEAHLYANYRQAFKPAAVDFGPDYTPALLSPETADSYEAGFKGDALDGRLDYQLEAFQLDFSNLVVSTPSGALVNAGGERLRGTELEVHYDLNKALAVIAAASYHDAIYTQYLFFDGVSTVNVAGRELPLSPHLLASAGILYTPARGLSASLIAQYVGRRFLDEENTAPVGGYTTLHARLGYRWGRYSVTLDGTNLTNRRPPVTASEFGSESFYLLPARMLWVKLGCHL